MNLYHFSTMLAVVAAVTILVIMITYLLVITLRTHDTRAFSWTYILFIISVWGSVVGWNHLVHPQQHRLYFDEDVYANMAHNILSGYGGKVTQAWTDETKIVHDSKWPLGFPTLMSPFVLWFGTEKGPAIFNECCGALTLIVLMALAARLASTGLAAYIVLLLYGLHPVVGGWYRSGSSEPLAILMLSISLCSAIESNCRFKVADANYSDWMVVSLIAGFLAMQIRLENIIIFLSLFWIYRKSRVSFSIRHWIILLIGGAPLLLSYAVHVLTLKNYYLADLPESSFSVAYFLQNLSGNFKFLWQYSPWPLLLFTVIAAFIYIRRVRADNNKSGNLQAWIALMLIPLVHFTVLLFYSVGRYDVAGGSRFFLFQMMGLSVVSAALLLKISPRRYRYWSMIAATIFFLLVMPDRNKTWQNFNMQISSPAIEHELILKWSDSLSSQAVIISKIPYLWENCGTYALLPQYLNRNSIPHSKTIYEHHGLFNLSNGQAKQDSVEIDSAMTRHGKIVLHRLPDFVCPRDENLIKESTDQ